MNSRTRLGRAGHMRMAWATEHIAVRRVSFTLSHTSRTHPSHGTTNWRAGCGRSACPVRREGGPVEGSPYPYRGRCLLQQGRKRGENFHARTSLVVPSPPSSAFGTLRLAALAQGRLFSPRKSLGGRRRSMQTSAEGLRDAEVRAGGIPQRAKRNQPTTRAAQSTREAQ
jgi:hypothetical protein